MDESRGRRGAEGSDVARAQAADTDVRRGHPAVVLELDHPDARRGELGCEGPAQTSEADDPHYLPCPAAHDGGAVAPRSDERPGAQVR